MTTSSDTSSSNKSTDQFDTLQTFLFEKSQIRGEIVLLNTAWKTILERKSYPPIIQKHLGEMVAAGALLSATLKFDGTLIIQAQGTGLVRLIVVECNMNLDIRATVKLAKDIDPAMIYEDSTLSELINPDGQGKLAITLDPKNRQDGQQAYQGIVPLMLGGKPITSIAQAVMAYMNYSEQLETHILLSSNDTHAGGILIQKLPNTGGKTSSTPIDHDELAEDWNRVMMMVNTVKDEELLSTSPTVLMQRLFLDEANYQGVRGFPLRHVHFACQCSREKVGNMMLMLGKDEVAEILAEQQQVETTCDFCGQVYLFDLVDCQQLFAADNLVDKMKPPQGKH
jgi:molecular chaperone Hsp33